MTVMSEGLLLNSKYIKMGREKGADRTLTRQNQMLRDDNIYLARWNKKTNKQNGRLLSFLYTFDPDT